MYPRTVVALGVHHGDAERQLGDESAFFNNANLNTIGHRQMEAVCKELRPFNIVKLLTPPLARTRASLAVIAKGLELTIPQEEVRELSPTVPITDPVWKERSRQWVLQHGERVPGLKEFCLFYKAFLGPVVNRQWAYLIQQLSKLDEREALLFVSLEPFLSCLRTVAADIYPPPWPELTFGDIVRFDATFATPTTYKVTTSVIPFPIRLVP